MKKVLSVILAIMMIATFVPMVFAEGECKHSFDVRNCFLEGYDYCEYCGVKSADFTELYKNYYIEFQGLMFSVGYDEKGKIPVEYVADLYNDSEAVALLSSAFRCGENEQDYVDCAAEKLDAFVKEVRSKSTIIFDGTEFVELFFSLQTYPEDVLRDAEKLFSEDDLLAFNEYVNGYSEYITGEYCDFKNHEEAKIRGEKALYYLKSVKNCLDGAHTIDTCTDNGDGTHSFDCTFCNVKDFSSKHEWGEYVRLEDGSKVAECKYCEATDVDSFEKDILDFIRMLVELIKSFIEAMSA